MKTNAQVRQEAIKAAWGDLYEKVKNELDENGAYFGDCDIIPDELFNSGSAVVNDKFVTWPKELRNIGNNNGWTRIEPDGSNLPSDDRYYHVGFTNWDGKFCVETNFNYGYAAHELKGLHKNVDITHYRPVPPPIPDPIY